ncbi:MAG: hypothetical protein HC911_02430 [Chloroflexaceae bacterium]|nr:hypothetical protein [Chloroflexaceae bacterium]
MRRNVVLPLLIVVLLLAAAGVGAFFFLSGSIGGGGGGQTETVADAVPTPVPVTVIGARVDIPVGTVITDTATLLEPQQISQNEFNAQPNEFFTSEQISDVRGKLTLVPLIGGQPILRSQLTEPGLSQQIPPAEDGDVRRKAYPVQVDSLTGVADQVNAGDFVDVVVSRVFFYSVDGREFRYPTSKTLVQNAQVLRVLRPAPTSVDAEGGATAPPPGDAAPETAPALDAQGRPIADSSATGAEGTLREGRWVLIIAVTNQEAEILEYARGISEVDRDIARIALVLRGAGDTDIEDTTGISEDILFDQYGVPFPGINRLIIVSPGQQ